jgi:RNA polymerase sigma factor (sigma-70 family)
MDTHIVTTQPALDPIILHLTDHIRDEDVRQEAILKLLEAGSIEIGEAETIVRRTQSRAAWHQRQTYKRQGPMPTIEDIEDAEPYTGKLYEAVCKLPVELRDVILLRFVCDLTVAETAARLNLSTRTVKRRQAAAQEMLRAAG